MIKTNSFQQQNVDNNDDNEDAVKRSNQFTIEKDTRRERAEKKKGLIFVFKLLQTLGAIIPGQL